jgi:type I restriction enzyme S subunit
MSTESVAESIPPGYKQTEVGVIPENWHLVTIGDCAIKVGSGITPRGGNSNYKEYGRPFVRSQNVGWGTLLLNDLVYIDDDTHKSFSSTELQQGDVLLNITGASIGRSAIAEAHLAGGNVNQHVCIIRTDTSKVVSRFLNYIILSSQGQRQIDSFQAGGNREGLNFGQIRSIRFPLPPTLVEQEAIAATLSDTDAFIESLEQLIAKKRRVKQGAMQELLTGKKRLPGFSGEWKVKEIQEISDVDIESLTITTQPNYEFKYISLEEVDCGTLKGWTEHIFATAPSRARRKIRKGDVLISTVRPNLQSHCLIKEEWNDFVCSTGFSVLRCKSELANPYYVFAHFFSSYIGRQIEALISGSNYPAINSSDVKKLKIPLPPSLEEQEAIATILSDMDADITTLKEKLAKTRQIKQGMMQELLTGRIRLV